MIQNLEYEYSVVINIENEKYGININLRKLLLTLYSLIIFYIFYKYNIQLIPENYIGYIKIYLNICFIYYIILIMYNIVIGLYKIIWLKKPDIDDNLGHGILLFIRLITFLINMFIFYYLLNLTIDLFLQYNILLIIDLIMIVVFNYYKYIYDYEIKKNYKPAFLNYPWLMLIIAIILIKRNKNIDNMFWFISDVAEIYENNSI